MVSPDSNRMVFTIRDWLDSLGVVLAFLISLLKTCTSHQSFWHGVTDFTSFEEHLESSSVLSCCPNEVKYRFKNIFLRWSRLQTKESQKRTEFCLAWLENSRDHYGSSAWPFYRLVQSVTLWLTRRWGLYNGTCPKLLRGDKALILVPCGC